MSRIDEILSGGGGHAGYQVRLLAEHSDESEQMIALLAELVGRIADLEREAEVLKTGLVNARSQIQRLQRERGGAR